MEIVFFLIKYKEIVASRNKKNQPLNSDQKKQVKAKVVEDTITTLERIANAVKDDVSSTKRVTAKLMDLRKIRSQIS